MRIMKIWGYARPIWNYVKIVLKSKNLIEMGQLISQTKDAYG